MIYPDESTRNMMGELHNILTLYVDSSPLSPPEVIIVLRMMANNIEKLFEASVKGD